MTLTTQKDIEEYIKTAENIGLEPDASYTLKELTGGTANFVWRLTSNTGKTSIIKHAESFVRFSPQIKQPTDRMDFEAKIQEALPLVLDQDDVVQTAPFFGYDQSAHILHIGDGGAENLKEAYSSDASLDVLEAGKRLGQWLARLHKSTASMDIGDAKTAKAVYRFNYNNLATSLNEYGHDPKLGEQINEEFGSLLATDDKSICHGDFWPGNVLVRTNPLRLTIVDWEMTRRGNGVTDVGQFAAESWLLDRFRGGEGMMGAFLHAYRAGREVDWPMDDRRRVAVQFGTHIAFWPTRVEWGGIEETFECVKLGSEILKRARDKDYEWLGESVLTPLFS